MLTFFRKKYSFTADATAVDFKKLFTQKVPRLNYNELRKQWIQTPVYYGTLKNNEITIHYHAARKRDLDAVYYDGKITETDGGVRVDGSFRRSTKNTIMAAVITVVWVLIAIVCFTQNIYAGLFSVAALALCVYLFYWDEGKQGIIEMHIGEIVKEAEKTRNSINN